MGRRVLPALRMGIGRTPVRSPGFPLAGGAGRGDARTEPSSSQVSKGQASAWTSWGICSPPGFRGTCGSGKLHAPFFTERRTRSLPVLRGRKSWSPGFPGTWWLRQTSCAFLRKAQRSLTGACESPDSFCLRKLCLLGRARSLVRCCVAEIRVRAGLTLAVGPSTSRAGRA